MASTKKSDDDYSEEEAQKRFESAVDAALHTPPMHRESKPQKKKKTKPKSKR